MIKYPRKIKVRSIGDASIATYALKNNEYILKRIKNKKNADFFGHVWPISKPKEIYSKWKILGFIIG